VDHDDLSPRLNGNFVMRAMIIFGGLLLAGAVAAQPGPDPLLQQRLQAHLEFLADDLLRGRQPGTDGYNIAAAYVASQFRQLGLQPAGENGGFYQPVPLRSALQLAGSARLAVLRDGASHPLKFVDQFYTGPSEAHTQSDITAPMVFAGYGIDAPELDYDDYADIDATGKVVVILGGQPASFPSEEGAHFGSSREKTRAAVSHGAIGIVTVYTPRNEKRYAWDRVRSLVGMPAMGWLTEGGDVFGSPDQIQGHATVNYAAAGVFFEGAPHPLEELLAMDEAGQALPTFDLSGEVRMSQASRHEVISSPNVVAFLPGADPLLADEYVVYTAHLDHIGELAGEGSGDRINNGALDNASGVAVMLETARLFAGKKPPRRSVLFVAVTAEEKGMVGSEYFAQHPTVPVQSMVGEINLDMPLLLYDFADVIAFGATHSTLGDAVQAAADEAGVALTPDPFPEQNIFVRSDHYRFVQRGIPSIFLVTGIHSRDPNVDALALFEGFLHEHYHKPSDDTHQPINYAAAARFTRINARIGEIVANQRERPAWHEGDFFGDTFAP